MRPYGPSSLTRVPLVLLDQAQGLGADRRALMAAAGLTAAELKDPDGRIPSEKVWKIWHALSQQFPDDALGLRMMEGKGPAAPFGLVSYSLYYSRTLRRALHRLSRYSRIVAENVRLHVETEDDQCCIVLESDPHFEALRHPIDLRLANIVILLRQLSGNPLSPMAVDLPYPKLKDVSHHRRFFTAPLRFGQPKAALHYRAAQMELPIQQADETLASYLDRLAEQKLRELEEKTWTGKVSRALWTELSSGAPTLERIASILSVSPRSLQRFLNEEGTSFRQVLEDLRRRMSAHLLNRKGIAASEVAFLLGYADPTSFHHAFRRWHRTSPRSYRRAG